MSLLTSIMSQNTTMLAYKKNAEPWKYVSVPDGKAILTYTDPELYIRDSNSNLLVSSSASEDVTQISVLNATSFIGISESLGDYDFGSDGGLHQLLNSYGGVLSMTNNPGYSMNTPGLGWSLPTDFDGIEFYFYGVRETPPAFLTAPIFDLNSVSCDIESGFYTVSLNVENPNPVTVDLDITIGGTTVTYTLLPESTQSIGVSKTSFGSSTTITGYFTETNPDSPAKFQDSPYSSKTVPLSCTAGQIPSPSVGALNCTANDSYSNYTLRVPVTNNANYSVTMYVAINGALQSRTIGAGVTSTFFAYQSGSWGGSSIQIKVHATATGHTDSSQITVYRTASCPIPPGGGLVWRRVGLSSTQLCNVRLDDPEGTSCTTLGETMTTGITGGSSCYDYVCGLR